MSSKTLIRIKSVVAGEACDLPPIACDAPHLKKATVVFSYLWTFPPFFFLAHSNQGFGDAPDQDSYRQDFRMDICNVFVVYFSSMVFHIWSAHINFNFLLPIVFHNSHACYCLKLPLLSQTHPDFCCIVLCNIYVLVLVLKHLLADLELASHIHTWELFGWESEMKSSLRTISSRYYGLV